MQLQDIETKLKFIINEYPPDLRSDQLKDIKRIAFNIHISLSNRDPKNLTICDIGGGIGLFSVGCAMIGFKKVFLIDDFNDTINKELGNSIFSLHNKFGVNIITRDIIKDGFGSEIIKNKIDIITSFDSIEHWHHSPKIIFREIMNLLNADGVFVLSAPNCVNIRKRLTVPFGRGKWSRMSDWYENQVFRGHVREPDVDDLLYIARDMGLSDIKVYGRNWLGYNSKNKIVNFITPIIDYPLRVFPKLSSNIYIVGFKRDNSIVN